MIRLLLLLCAGLFLTLQFAGEDRGQKRLGQLLAEEEAAELAQAQALAAAKQAQEPEDLPPAAEALSEQAQVVQVSFAPQQPLITADALPASPDSVAADTLGSVKFVNGRSVNVRSGPSTRDGIVGKLTRGEAVTVVWVEDNGWARIRVEGDGVDGFVSMELLADAAP